MELGPERLRPDRSDAVRCAQIKATLEHREGRVVAPCSAVRRDQGQLYDPIPDVDSRVDISTRRADRRGMPIDRRASETKILDRYLA